MTTYAEFKDFYIREIWREGDTALISDLDRLIARAEAHISRALRQTSVIGTHTVNLLTDNTALPGDFREVLNASIDGKPLTLRDLGYEAAALSPTKLSFEAGKYYWIKGNDILFNLPTLVSPPLPLTMTYYAGVVPYASNPALPFYDKHPDFYTAAVNVEVYGYLRDFALSQEYNSKFSMLLEEMQRESGYMMYPSGQLQTPMPDTQ